MGEKNSIRLVTADDLPLMRSGLRAFLTAYEEFSLVGEASNGEEAIQLCELLKPDIVLMDLKMPVMDGVSRHPPDPPALAEDQGPGADQLPRYRAGPGCAPGWRGRACPQRRHCR